MLSSIGEGQGISCGKITGKERVIESAAEAVHITHHAGWAMKNLEVVAEEFLRPAANLVDQPVVFQNFAHGAAVAEPKEYGAPEKFAVLTDTPASAGSLANK